MDEQTLLRAAYAWRDDDPDPETMNELSQLLALGDVVGLRERFEAPLTFGTAGLRGLLGAGPGRMNQRVVARTTSGLCQVLESHFGDSARDRGIVIGFDARKNSKTFARLTAEVAMGLGFRCHLFDRLVPTPLVGFAVSHLGTAAGVMVTASHNPPGYNGYKVFWGNGAQIIPPIDTEVASASDLVSSVASLSRIPPDDAEAPLTVLGGELIDHYFAGLRPLPLQSNRQVRIAYTPLHGVGAPFVSRALSEAGFEDLHIVASQAEPDGAFPTVSFPNPEEPGAMDEVLSLAERVQADLVLASDPDTDRLSVAAERGGEWVVLSGNEVGCLLAHYLLSQGEPTQEHSRDRLVLNTIVSSPMLLAIAEAHGARAEQTLTGFKWIMNRALELADTHRLVLGYEEALGYCVGEQVRDKDGVSAALLAADLAAWCQSQGRTLLDELEVMERRYGIYASRQRSLTFEGPGGRERIQRGMERLRSATPATLGGLRVLSITDYGSGIRRTTGGVEELDVARAEVLAFTLEGGQAMARPSGTEPKLKLYFDVFPTENSAVSPQRGELEGRLRRLEEDVMELAGVTGCP